MMYTFGVEVPRCQHVRTTGIRCGSPALHGKKHCYYHSAFGQTRVVRELEDAESIQLAVRQVINWIAQGMDTKRAALTLYALQIASANLKRMARIIHASDVVRELPEEADARASRAAARRKKSSRTSETRNPKLETASKKPAVSMRPRKQNSAQQSVKSARIRGENFTSSEQPAASSEVSKKPNGHVRETRNEEPETTSPAASSS